MAELKQSLECRLNAFNQLESHVGGLPAEIKRGISEFDNNYSTAKKDIESKFVKIIEKVKQLQSQLLSVLTDGYNLEKERMESKLKETEKLHQTVKERQLELQKALSSFDDSKTTVANSGVAENNSNEWIDKVKKLHKSIKCFKISFRPKTLNSLKSVAEVGEVFTEELPFVKKLPDFKIPDAKPPPKPKPQEKVPAPQKKTEKSEEDNKGKTPVSKKKLEKRLESSASGAEEGPTIEMPEREWGGEFSPGGELPMTHLYKDNTILVVVGNPHKLMLFSKKGVLIKDVKMSTWPIDLCVFDEKIALSLYNENKIVVHNAETFEMVSEFDVGGRCFSVCHLGENFIVSFPREKLVRKYDEEGALIKASGKIFGRPTFLVSHPSKAVFLVSDSMKNGIFCLNAELTSLWQFIEPRLKDPRKMCYVEEGILVCGVWSDNIVLVSERGKFLRTVLSSENSKIQKPRTVCDNTNNDTIIVSEDGGKIRIFLKDEIPPLEEKK